MPEIERLTQYTPEVGEAVRGLLVELSRSGRDRGEIPKEWFLEVIDSPYHDLILAKNGEQILGI